jgi:osmotically-inducible protein OsmY
MPTRGASGTLAPMDPQDPTPPRPGDRSDHVVDAVDVLDRIRTDFVRHELLDHATITVDVHGATVTLTGTVGSRAERDEAERIALATTGVDAVHNLLRTLHGDSHDKFRR